VHPVDDIRGTLSSRLAGRTIVLGVTGSIAGVECVHLARELARHGARVVPVMTQAATRIVHPDALWFATGVRPVLALTGDVEHVRWTGSTPERADLLLIAPATANTIGKVAAAIDDTPVTTFATTALGTGIPVVLAPAMHGTMWDHPQVLRNVDRLREMGVDVVTPREEEGKAKLADAATIVAHCARALARGPLKGRRVVVVAGSTEEPIDDVRVISNRSTGALGRALAEEAFARGAEVVVLLGRHEVPPPPYVEVRRFTTVDSLAQLARAVPKDAAAVLAAAAVGDYRLAQPVEGKVPSGRHGWDLHLVPAPKVLPELRAAAPRAVLVAFKLESGADDRTLEEVARERLAREVEDVLVANDLARVTADHHPAVVLARGADPVRHDGGKQALAALVLDTVERGLG
jgi:phosphopantothenoylcysteine decarboxylase/phosphopantothenate--cysteine ligase